MQSMHSLRTKSEVPASIHKSFCSEVVSSDAICIWAEIC